MNSHISFIDVYKRLTQIELSALVVEAVGNLVANDVADSAVVHVPRPRGGEEDALHVKIQ